MGASASRGRPARVPAPEPEPEETLDLSQLPPELLLVVLSHVPPRALLARCRRVCRGWRALVDGQALWLLILARDHGALLPLARSCLPQARDAGPCLLGRFCERAPIGRNLIRNPCGQGGEPGEGATSWEPVGGAGGGAARSQWEGQGGAARSQWAGPGRSLTGASGRGWGGAAQEPMGGAGAEPYGSQWAGIGAGPHQSQ